MDVRYFLERRLTFIEQLYENAASPFLERIRKIEAEEEPFIPKYSEDPEPPFLAEWIEANDSLQVLGRSCVSMLAASFHVYFKTWEKQLRKPVTPVLKPTFSKRGWFAGYKSYFSHYLGIRFEESGCNLALLEEIVLARNRVQHPETITTHHSHYSQEDLRKLQSPFFVGERELELLSAPAARDSAWLLPPQINVTAEHLHGAILEVRKFVEWLETSDRLWIRSPSRSQ
ncbi:hypothetical protein [Caenimonas soli]|uniref:hypothetical protein n=1 Tax=Caenimonas soli TaxID=2735555 RepID=UPI001554D9F5|nr:hypothetical protein [Caenimonas soli]NPC56657.1 hypothetical protein [Caenimonas soli]